MLIFSYGSNMCIARLRRRTPSARPICVARLPGHALRFHKRSIDGSGKADAYVTNDDSDAVWGVVYELTADEKPDLDKAEGLGSGYDEKWVCVTSAEGSEQEVQLYVATAIDASLRPYRWYRRYVVEGALQHGLPADYVKMIARQPCIADPDGERAAANSDVAC